MNTGTSPKVIIPDLYDTSVNNTKLNNTFPISALDLDPSLIPGVSNADISPGSGSSGNITIEDLDIEEVYDPIYEITTTRNERIAIFELISEEDAKMVGLGSNMPIDFIMFDVIVPPPKLRGASHKEVKNESDRMADFLIGIIKANDKIKSGTLSDV